MNVIEKLIHDLKVSQDFADLFAMMMRNGRGKNIFEYYKQEQLVQLSYEEYERKVMGCAGKIREVVKSEEKFVALKLPNGPEFCILFWAILAAGFDLLLLNSMQNTDDAIEMMAQAGTETLITDKLYEDFAYLAAADLIAEADSFPEETSWGDRIALCTSGTTGDARIFVHDSGCILNLATCLIRLSDQTDRWVRPGVNEKCLAFLPFHHIFGLMAVFMLTYVLGNTFIFIPSLAPEVILESCRKHRVTQVISIPLFWNAVVKGLYRRIRQIEGEKTVAAFDKMIDASLKAQAAGRKVPFYYAPKLKSIRNQLLGDDVYLGCSGGGYIPAQTLRVINGLGYYLSSGYGMTEGSIISVCNTEDIDLRCNGNVGRPFEPDNMMISPAGEILLRGRSIHIGVLKSGQFRAVDYTGDSWFPTGDIGRLVDGAIMIDGRLKEVIIGPSGENIYPDTVEANFQDLPGVQQMSVVGVRDGDYEYANLLLEVAPEADPAELDQAVKARMVKLPPSSAISNVLVSLAPLPLSTTRKVKRQLLSKQLNAGQWPVLTLSRYLEAKAAGMTISSDQQAAIPEVPTAPPPAAVGAADKAEPAPDTESGAKADADTISKEKIKETIRGFFAEALDIKLEEVTDNGHFVLDLGGDSLSSLTLLNLLEREYNIAIVDDQYYSCMNLNDITSLIHEHLSGTDYKPGRKAGISTDGRAKTPEERVDAFEKIREIKQFVQRSEQLLASSNMQNPYFISQESALKDVSYMGGREMINLGSYNYLAMSGDPEVNAAAIAAVEKYGTSASGSRLLAGEKDIHKDLEAAIARWKGTEDALVLVSGHATNVTFVGNFCGSGDLIIYDRLSHNSVIQGLMLSRARSRFFPHNDYEELENFLKEHRDEYEKVLIVVEGAYSMDGDVAPVPEFVRIKKKYGCFLMVDEAHSACVLGETGKGVDEYFDLAPSDIDIKMGTLSKGLGACGGYLAADKLLIDYLRYNLPGFTFSVGLSPALTGAVLKVLEIMERDNSRVKALQDNIAYFMKRAHEYGFNTCLAKDTAIIPIMIGPDDLAFKLSIEMLDDGIIVPPAIFPAVPMGQARLRYCLTSAHKPEQIDYALEMLRRRLAAAIM
ncbi:MAG: aminotransferase class I/II-fold pyridoxal phosphate-dependent enzyme [Saccharofermentanales bacterium]|jgi:8-amino-7-oxononanoate synthase/acyl carrier protein